MPIIRFSLFLFTTLIFLSCSTPRAFVSKKTAEPSKPLNNYLLLYSVITDDLQDMGEANYNTYLKGNFNNLQDKFFRDNLVAKYIALAEMGTVWDYRNLFDDFKAYGYQEFEEIVEKNGIDFILLVTEKRFIPREQLPSITNHQLYLFERGVDSPIWVSYGYPGSLSGRMAKGIHKELTKEGFL